MIITDIHYEGGVYLRSIGRLEMGEDVKDIKNYEWIKGVKLLEKESNSWPDRKQGFRIKLLGFATIATGCPQKHAGGFFDAERRSHGNN